MLKKEYRDSMLRIRNISSTIKEDIAQEAVNAASEASSNVESSDQASLNSGEMKEYIKNLSKAPESPGNNALDIHSRVGISSVRFCILTNFVRSRFKKFFISNICFIIQIFCYKERRTKKKERIRRKISFRFSSKFFLIIKQSVRSVSNFSDSLRNLFVPEQTNWNECQP